MQKEPARLFFVEPMECKPVDSLPDNEGWQYEIKFDGYRAIATKQRGEVDVYSRRGNSFNADYPEIAEALSSMRCKIVRLRRRISGPGWARPTFLFSFAEQKTRQDAGAFLCF